jgi:dCTP deaminase
MILTGPQILREMEEGHILVDPFDASWLGPNGIDWHLHSSLIALTGDMDARQQPEGEHHQIGPQGFVLQPGILYLGLTMQTIAAHRHAQWIWGDRNAANLGIWVHVSAPLGHTGSRIRWTLEIKVVRPVRVYAGLKLGKVCFLENAGAIARYGDPRFVGGKYLHNGLSVSRLMDDDATEL